MKFTPVIDFTNISQAAFELIFFCQKITSTNCRWRQAAQNSLYKKVPGKMWVKLTLGVPFINPFNKSKKFDLSNTI